MLPGAEYINESFIYQDVKRDVVESLEIVIYASMSLEFICDLTS